jgi:hypothetical protein
LSYLLHWAQEPDQLPGVDIDADIMQNRIAAV